jgi:hypothetical protein
MAMPRSTIRLLLGLLVVAALGGILSFDILRKKGEAEDLVNFQSVPVCTTDRDVHTGKQSCPSFSEAMVALTCEDAKAALKGLVEIKLRHQVDQAIPEDATNYSDCEIVS